MATIVVDNLTNIIIGEIEKKLVKTSKAIAKEWQQEARAKIVHGVEEYMAGIVDEGSTSKSAVVSLQGSKANVMEHGLRPFDVKDVLLRPSTSGIKPSKGGGLYLDVPMEKSGAAVAKILGSNINRYLRTMKPYASAGTARAARARSKARIADRPGTLAHALTGGRSKSEPKMRARAGTVERVKQAGLMSLTKEFRPTRPGAKSKVKTVYVAFRRASRKGKPWIHPGVRARRVALAIMRKVPQIVDGVISGRHI